MEDGVVAGKVDLTRLDTAAVWETVRAWYLPDATDAALDDVLARLRAVGSWPGSSYDGRRASLAARSEASAFWRACSFSIWVFRKARRELFGTSGRSASATVAASFRRPASSASSARRMPYSMLRSKPLRAVALAGSSFNASR